MLLSAVLTSRGLEVSSLPEMDSSSYTIATPTDEAEEDDDDVRWLAVCAIIVGVLFSVFLSGVLGLWCWFPGQGTLQEEKTSQTTHSHS